MTEAVLVTGGRGFIGSHVVRLLQEAGHPVVEYNREPPSADAGDAAHTVVQGELHDVARLVGVLHTHAISAIVHTAGISHPALSLDLATETLQVNLMGSLSVLDAARLCGVRRTVVMSSECAYGPTGPEPLSEDAPLRPSTPYGISKAALDGMVAFVRRHHGLDVVSLRLGQVYGPGQRLAEDLHDIIREALDTGRVTRRSGADQRLELVHVRDAARAAVMAALWPKPFTFPAYNISAGSFRFEDVLKTLAAILPDVVIDVGNGTLGYEDRGPFDTGRAREEWGFRPEVPLREGLQHYADWLQRHPF